jgi:nucleotide-binding universal stress UspA family protein
MLRVDAFLVADELPYTTAGWTRRNRVRGPDGPEWLTLPARPEPGQRIDEVALEAQVPWARKHATTLRHLYARGCDVDEAVAGFEKAVAEAGDSLAPVATASLRFLADRLGVETPILVSSQLGLEARYAERFPGNPGPTHRIVAYCEALGADELLEGASGRSYFDVALFASHGLQVHFHDYVHPAWPQLHEPFVSHLSAMDLLLCVGPERARRVLRSGGVRDDG